MYFEAVPEPVKPTAAESPRIQWGDLAITVGISLAVVALMLTPAARKIWLPESIKPEVKK